MIINKYAKMNFDKSEEITIKVEIIKNRGFSSMEMKRLSFSGWFMKNLSDIYYMFLNLMIEFCR